MKPDDVPHDLFAQSEGLVAFRLFADQVDPTLTVSEQIAARVGDRILAGQMAPGERIGEQELADEFAVSRGPIRDALRVLEREGLVTILARRGAIVTELRAQELRELLEIRAGLFEIVVRKLVAQADASLIALLESGVDRLESLAALPDAGDAYAETTYRLLILCARQCGNVRLQRMLTAISLQTLRYSKLGLASVERRRRSASLWRQATVALRAGDAERMVALARQRIEESAEEAVAQLSRRFRTGGGQ
jgi:DNA-binding GntR family transcriptional regulator